MDLFGSDLALMSRLMSVATKRHEVTAMNLANINVPEFRARTLRFEEDFQQALREGGADKALTVRAQVEVDEDAPIKADGNSVHLEREFALMQKNQLLYGVWSTIMKKKLDHIRMAISGGNR